jgi:predicted phage baseplate assembly protein
LIEQEAPKIDRRSGEQIFHDVSTELKERLDIDADSDDPLAGALLRVFSRYCELIIQRLNRVPDKNHIAFLDALKVSRIAPVPAQVPLTFTPVKKLPGARPAVVPAYTRVAAAPGEGESEPTVYETVRKMVLTNVEIRKVVALDPQADLYADKSSLALATVGGGGGEFAFEAREPVEHAFYLGHAPIFGKTDISELRLHWEIEGGLWSEPPWQALAWWIPTRHGKVPLIPVKDTTSQLTQSGEVVFRSMPEWPAHEIWGRETHWLGCRLLDRLPSRVTTASATASGLPRIRTVTISAAWEVEETVVDHALFNNLPLDLSKDFFPFGERPRFGDVFYLSCDVFSRPQAEITLKFTLTNPASAGENSPIPPVNKTGRPRIQWEYWDGRRWVVLACRDDTEAFTEDGEVFFLAPSPFPPTTVNGIEGCWLRARLVSGNYGEDERFEFISQAQGLGRIPSTLAPPSIQSVTVASSSTAGPEQPEFIVTNNNFVFEEVDSTASFQPFCPALEPHRALYLGFKAPDDDQIALANRDVDLYCHISGSRERASIRDDTVQQLPLLTWQYWNGKAWTTGQVRDGTESLTMPGMVSVRAGEDITPWSESSLDRELYWFRVLWIAGEFESSPMLRRLLLNTVLATQTFTLQHELLGSSNGLPNQLFRSARTPILHDLQLEVREPDLPAAEELTRLYQEEGDDAVTVSRNAQGEPEQIWVRWHEVGDFLSSTNRDRHFVVDRQTGDIRFGDSTKGLIPSVGTNNIRLCRYQTGGGAFGNKPAGRIAQLRTSVPYVDAVRNLEPALGGQDIEEWDAVRQRGASGLRHRGRAVTMEDYEDLAKLASPVIAKAKCYPNRDLIAEPAGRSPRPGVVSLIVVARSEEPRPLPDLLLLRRVRNFLHERRVPDTELVVLAPEYVRASVEATVVATNAPAGASINAQCQQELAKYLHPLTGGPHGRGWEFGQRPHESDLYALLESVRGLEYVRSLYLRMEEERPGLLESGIFLICSGEHHISPGP